MQPSDHILKIVFGIQYFYNIGWLVIDLGYV